MSQLKLDSISEAIKSIARGEMVVVVDDEDRENEGDLILAADFITAEKINFMATHARGLICAPITLETAKKLELDLMVRRNTSNHETAFTVSVDARLGTETGISAEDRMQTIKILASNNSMPEDLLRPGHIFPLIAKNGGVLERPGHTEAAIDLAKLAGCSPTGVICEIVNIDGTMARYEQLHQFAKLHKLLMISIKDLIEYRKQEEEKIHHLDCIDLQTKYGGFKFHLFENKLDLDNPHVVLSKGQLSGDENILVRIHSECLTGDVFSSMRCDCGEQLDKSLELIAESEKGMLIYLRQEGRGIGLINKIKAYRLQDQGLDTVDANLKLGFSADNRNYDVAKQILDYFQVKKINLMTNNPEKMRSFKGCSIQVGKRIPLEAQMNGVNAEYLKAKRDRLGHFILGNEEILQ